MQGHWLCCCIVMLCSQCVQEHIKAQADKQQHKASGASLQGSSSLTQWLWDRMCLFGVEVNRMLQLLAAAAEVRLLKGSCEQGSNDGTKVKTILCRSHDI